GDLALVVGVLDLVLGRDRLDLRLAEAWTAGLGEVAERQQLEAVTVLADVVIDLEAALQLGAVVSAERAGERPFVRRRRLALLGRGAGGRADEPGQPDRQRQHGDGGDGLALL